MRISTVTEESIVQLVDSFYDQIRETPELKDIFENAIGKTKEDWHEHLQKMYAFWSSLMLRSGRYQGNPMKAHKDLPYFPPEYRFHFNAHNLIVYGKENGMHIVNISLLSV